MSNVLRGFQLLASTVFGVELRPVPLQPNEDWSVHVEDAVEGAVLKMEMWENKALIGVIYFDLYG